MTMRQAISAPAVPRATAAARRRAGTVLLAAALGWPSLALAAGAAATEPADPLFSLATANEVLAALNPPTSIDKLESGNDLLLDLPDVARSGEVPVRLLSAMPRTRQMWLLSLQPDAEAKGSLLRQFKFGTNDPPEASTTVQLAATQNLLLVALAGGRYFGVQRQVKVGFDPGDARAR